MTPFLAIRVLHILLAATWFGAAVAMLLFVVPAVKEAKGAGGAVMAGLDRRKYHVFMQVVAGLTVLTGFDLYRRFTQGFDHEISASMAGRVFGTGGIAGILALVIGASVVGRTMKKIADTMIKAAALPDGPEKAALVASVGPMQARAGMFGKLVLLLMVVAIVAMSIGHYV
jgi:hypothetical protein